MFEGSAHHDHGFFPPLQEAGRLAQRLDERRSHELLGGRADRRAGARAVARVRSDGLSAARADAGQVRRPSARWCSTSGARTTRTGRTGWRAWRCRPRCIRRTIRITGRRSVSRRTCARPRSTTCARSSRGTTTRATPRSCWPATSTSGERARPGARLLRRYAARARVGTGRGAAGRRADGEVRLVLEDRVELPRLYLAWRSPALFAAGDAELDLVADVLANGKTSRLYRALVHERRIALDVSAAQQSRELEGHVPDRRHRRARPRRSTRSTRRSRESSSSSCPRRADRRRAGARPGAGRGALRLPAADGRRLQRQVGPAERLQRHAVDPGLLRPRTSRATAALTPVGSARRVARRSSADRRVALSVVPARPGALALAGSSRAVVS